LESLWHGSVGAASADAVATALDPSNSSPPVPSVLARCGQYSLTGYFGFNAGGRRHGTEMEEVSTDMEEDMVVAVQAWPNKAKVGL
jgi:hypothetical protein